MERIFVPSELSGTVKAPSSKSMTQRAIAAALLANGNSCIRYPSYCDDSLAAMNVAVGLGAKVEPGIDELWINGSAVLKEPKLNCGESGLAIRMFSPIAALYTAEITMTGAASLRNRPMTMIEDALNQLGAECKTTGGFLPLTIKGPINGGNCEIDGSVSSQLLTGLLMALPVADRDTEIKVNNLKSRPYIDMTIQLLQSFGIDVHHHDYTYFHVPGKQKYVPSVYKVEGDWSGAAFLLVAGAIGGKIKVTGLKRDTLQSDIAILDALRSAGANISFENDDVEVSRSELKSFEFDATHSPDLFPPLVALASYCDGISRIKGVSRLKHKESDRSETLKKEFAKMNILIETADDVMTISGGNPIGAHVESHEDHRIAMALAVTSLLADSEVFLRDSQCISKSYPDFYRDIRSLGAVIHE